ncbi:MAG TPA: CoA transferase [Jatrophihabitans sp.]|jgi:formyl-CoA transferase|uniref:CaiB/BaiF CoA transferase family protein n=1 Tax=Jatrophihabitans sp. TaxID=1932789 RepID=UPI002EE0C0B7
MTDPAPKTAPAQHQPPDGGAGPLADVLVIDLSRALAGPHAAMMLGDQGARVIKVEAPGHGDDTRGWGPPFVRPDPPSQGERESTYFLSCNRNKESITLDLKDPAGAAVLTRLVRQADVLVENFRTGVLDRLGFSMARLHELNPGLIILSITGFGHDGPEGGRPGYDQIAQGEGGLMSLTGMSPDEPTRVGVPIADLLAGMYGAYGVLAALHERDRTGRGQVVRTSLLAGMVGVHAFQGTRYTVAGEVPGVAGRHHPSICPYGLFSAADGLVQIAVGSDRLWQSFAAAFGLERPEWARNADRVADREAVIAAVDAAFGGYPRERLMTILAELGTPSGQVRSLDEVYEWEQTRSQGLLVEVDHSSLGALTLPGPPIRYDSGGRGRHQAPPTLGQHTGEILAWLDSVDPPD